MYSQKSKAVLARIKRQLDDKRKENDRIQSKIYYHSHKEKAKQARKKWRKKNPIRIEWFEKRRSASRREKSWDLTYKEFISFWQEPCHYCGNKIEKIGLDRVNNNDGYNIWNVVSCCFNCNIMKQQFSVKEFVDHCSKIVIILRGQQWTNKQRI